MKNYDYDPMAHENDDDELPKPPAIERVPVTSSQIISIGYHGPTQKLHIEFNGGSVYEYDDVKPEDHQALMDAESVGRCFGASIKGVYNYRRLPKEEPEAA